MISLRTLALLALLPLISLTARADSISASSVSSFELGPSADWLAFCASAKTMSLPGVFQQGGTFNVGDSGQLDGTYAFSFLENITIESVSSAVRIYGSAHVTPALDTLTIFASGPISVGAYTWSLREFDLAEANIQPYAIDLTADVTRNTTPEPAGLLLLGTGCLAVALATRRSMFRYQ